MYVEPDMEKRQGCIQDFGSGGGEMSKLKCRRGKVIRIVAVQMNLPDPTGGGETVPRGDELISPLAPPQISPETASLLIAIILRKN